MSACFASAAANAEAAKTPEWRKAQVDAVRNADPEEAKQLDMEARVAVLAKAREDYDAARAEYRRALREFGLTFRKAPVLTQRPRKNPIFK